MNNVTQYVMNNTLTVELVNQSLKNREIKKLGQRSTDKDGTFIYPVVDASITRDIFIKRIKSIYPSLIIEPYNNILMIDHGMCLLKYLQKNK